MRKVKVKEKKSHKVRNTFIVLFVLLLIAAGGVCGYGYVNLQPVGTGANKVEFKIEEGQSFDSVLEELESKQIIKSASITKLYGKLTGHQGYYAGRFDLNDGMSSQDVLAFIGNQENAKAEQVSLTVPEGTWAKEIAAKLSEMFPYTAEEILAQWNDIDYIRVLSNDYAFLNPGVLTNENYKVKLEGYLFPETYYLNVNATIDEITRTLLDGFNNIYTKYKAQFDASKLSVHEIVTLASVVQFESGTSDDMAKIAGVFYNRLAQNMRLESSVTVCYALYDDFKSAQDCEVKTGIESAYNTYLNDGLPVGPILNPGEEAIKATLEPEKHDYLFFVADIHGDGKVHYTKNFEDHQKKMKELDLVIDDSKE